MTNPTAPGRALPTGGALPTAVREEGLRRLRRTSNWTLAALIAGVGMTTALLERAATKTTGVTSAVGSTAPSGTTTTPTAPQLSAPVTTTTASGVVIPVAGGGAAGTTNSVAGVRTSVPGGDS